MVAQNVRISLYHTDTPNKDNMSTPQHPQQGSSKRQRIEKEEKDNKMEKATEKEEKQATPPDSLVKDPLWTEFQERANR